MKLNDYSKNMPFDSQDEPQLMGMNGQTSPHQSQRSSLPRKTLLYVSLLLLGAGGAVVGDRLLTNQPVSLAETPITQAPNTQVPNTQAPNSNPNTAPAPSRSAAAIPAGANFIAEAVQQVGPAVVRIDSQRTVETQSSPFGSPFGRGGDPFERFFGGQSPSEPSTQIQEGTGSGFIFDANGLILTNTHVVDGADRVTVVLKDGRQFEGKVLGEDPATDVAVIKIEANNLPTVQLGNSDQVQPGEWAIAIGNPLGLDNTVTAGIISATGRSSADIGVPDRRVGFIQTDAAINPGNSGGPLLNQQGEVIGMNTAIINGAQGLGFAVPINTARDIADQLIANGKVEHPYLGIQMATLTPQVKQQLNNDPNSSITVDEDQGVLVVRVAPDSPAAEAGIRAGDVLIKVGDQSVTDAESVQKAVEASQIGQTLPLQLRRDGQDLNISIKPGVLPAEALQ